MARSLKQDRPVVVPRLTRGQGRPSGGGLKPEQAREMILDAAEHCYERFGFSKTSIEDIAAEAGCSRTNVYRFFAGREPLLDAVLVRAVARRYPEFRDALASCSDGSELMVEAAVLTIQMIREEPAMAEILHQVQHGGEEPGSFAGGPTRQVARAWAEELAKGLPDDMLSEIRDGLTPALIGEHFFMTIIHLLSGITLIGESEDPDDIRWYVTNFVLPGILGDAPVTTRQSPGAITE